MDIFFSRKVSYGTFPLRHICSSLTLYVRCEHATPWNQLVPPVWQVWRTFPITTVGDGRTKTGVRVWRGGGMCDRDEACASAGYTRCAGLASLGSGLISLTHAWYIVRSPPFRDPCCNKSSFFQLLDSVGNIYLFIPFAVGQHEFNL